MTSPALAALAFLPGAILAGAAAAGVPPAAWPDRRAVPAVVDRVMPRVLTAIALGLRPKTLARATDRPRRA